jgi:hypothetical protein
MREIEVQIQNALESAMYKTRGYLDNVQSYNSVVEFHEQLLASQLDRLRVGRLDSQSVLQTEDKLFDAKVAALESLIQYEKAYLELELVTGSILVVRNLDITKPQLQARTAAYLSDRLSPAALEKYEREAAKRYYEDLSPKSMPTRRALDRLHEEISQQDLDAQKKAVDLLRERVQTLESGSSPGGATSSPHPAGTTAPRKSTDSAAQEKALELLRQQMQNTDRGTSPGSKPSP